MLWHIGNTTVRTPYRLQEALAELLESPLNGNLAGRAQEQEFARFLHETGIVEVGRIDEGLDASDLGRKWRVALSQLGFITPQLVRDISSGSTDPLIVAYSAGVAGLTGRQYEITPNGARLARADTVAAQQECFLRSLVAYRIPSPLEDRYGGEPFSPLQFVLDVIHELAQLGARPMLSFEEFALHVQTSTPEHGVEAVAKTVLQFRTSREAARGNVRSFDSAQYDTAAALVGRQASTLDDYADLTFRYLKATGLFRNFGRGIGVASNRAQLAELIRGDRGGLPKPEAYFEALWNGAALPTDNPATARVVVDSLAAELTARNIPTSAPPTGAALPDIEAARHSFEERLRRLDEEEYASHQSSQIEEIAGWLEALETRRPVSLPNGVRISVPRGDAPVYLEWAVWRAFLAINSLTIPPWECRRFAIDQDFQPVHCAPGGGPDMIFEFENAIIVVEVTLTASSRQEAAEGEPVRRHVAQYAQGATKPVFGLFMALQIDSNTAHTFSAGAWYLPDDRKISLNIVPIALADFRRFLLGHRSNLGELSRSFRSLLIECRAAANQDAPQWKQSIRDILTQASCA